jgi:sortase A
MKYKISLILGLVIIFAGMVIIARPVYRFVKRNVYHYHSKYLWNQVVNNISEGKPADTDIAYWLTIPSTDIDMPVIIDATKENLDKSVALNTDLTSQSQVIMGHRDTHFRNLKDLKEGAEIKLQKQDSTIECYQVKGFEITTPEKVSNIIIQRSAENSLTLMTCYPFDYIGPAPKRCIVWCRRVEKESDRSSIASYLSSKTTFRFLPSCAAANASSH